MAKERIMLGFQWPGFRPSIANALTQSQALSGCCLSAKGLTVTEPTAIVRIPKRLSPGWHRFKICIRSEDRATIRKKAEFRFISPQGEVVSVNCPSLSWNRSNSESVLFNVPSEIANIDIEFQQAEGQLEMPVFSCDRLAKWRTFGIALQEKLRLVRAYGCLKPVLFRAGRLLLQGRFLEVFRKLLKGLPDSQAMRIGVKQDQDIDGAWWRRPSLSQEEELELRKKIRSLAKPRTVTVILPVKNGETQVGHLTSQSLRRQIYPHWNLIMVKWGNRQSPSTILGDFARDSRVTIKSIAESESLEPLVRNILADIDTDYLMILPVGVELHDCALATLALHAETLAENTALGLPLVKDHQTKAKLALWSIPPCLFPMNLPQEIDVLSLTSWGQRLPKGHAEWLDKSTPLATLAGPIANLIASKIGENTEVPYPKTPLLIGANLEAITGYGHVIYQLIQGLSSQGVSLEQHPSSNIDPQLLPNTLRLNTGELNSETRTLAICEPMRLNRYRPSRFTAVYTMWETDDIPQVWVESLNRCGLVIVPSEWGAKCFRQSGVRVPIRVVPLGHDPLLYNDNDTWPEICTFGTAGALCAGGYRKNAQQVINVFRRAFPTETDVRLKVKVTPTSGELLTYQDPRIEVIRDIIPPTHLAEWYRSLTAYVNGSSGEGFGLHLLEAMSCGRPLISPQATGLTAFFDERVGLPISYGEVPVDHEIYQGRWIAPNESDMIAAMRKVYANPELARQLGDNAASRAKNFTWKQTGLGLLEALAEHDFLDRQAILDATEAVVAGAE